jgi:hypothetical protein
MENEVPHVWALDYPSAPLKILRTSDTCMEERFHLNDSMGILSTFGSSCLCRSPASHAAPLSLVSAAASFKSIFLCCLPG